MAFVQRATWYNPGEIDCVMETITSLLSEAESSSPPLRPAHIGIMAPWREHVWKLRERLRTESLHAVDVGTIEVRRHVDNLLTFWPNILRILGLPRSRKPSGDHFLC
jgi:hypothetical protein